MSPVRTILSALLFLTGCELCDSLPPDVAEGGYCSDGEIECKWICVTGAPADMASDDPCPGSPEGYPAKVCS